MRRIRSKDTTPELVVRRLVTKLGYRYRLHVKDLPGKPDLTFRGRKRVIFIHGCFWHQHANCRDGRIPGSRPEYWVPKLQRNVERDAGHANALRELGWDVLIVWECETADPSLPQRIDEFLSRTSYDADEGTLTDSAS
jgi:DNA mismatch endonuclease (patch repair protein)